MNLFKSVVQKVIDFILELIVPENIRIKDILKENRGTLYDRLPKAKEVKDRDVEIMFNYKDNTVKMIVKSIKYKSHSALLDLISLYMYEYILSLSSEASLWDGDPQIIIIPMPMSKREKRARGWSQTEELCMRIEKLFIQNNSINKTPDINNKIKFSYNTLIKHRETKRQTHLNKDQRLSNIKNSMSLNQNMEIVNRIKNNLVIIIDDVYTTGATFREAKKILRQAGSKKVLGLFIAH